MRLSTQGSIKTAFSTPKRYEEHIGPFFWEPPLPSPLGSRKFVILFIVSSCYCSGARDIVSVVCSIVLSKGVQPFMMPETVRELTPPIMFFVRQPRKTKNSEKHYNSHF